MKRLLLTLTAVMLFTGNANAADITKEIREGSKQPENNNGGYFEFGVSLNLLANEDKAFIRAGALLSGAYRYNRFFFEALTPGVSLPNGPISGVTAGINLWQDQRWSVDFLGINTFGGNGGGPFDDDTENSPEPERDKSLLERSSFYNGAGIRVTGYFGNSIFQYRLVTDTHGGNGIISSARLGYSHQLKNWNLHGILSANHASRETAQYWNGVTAEEATARYPAYDINQSVFNLTTEIGATYPLRENVVFRSTAAYTQRDEKVSNSPLVDGEFVLSWKTSISYVF